MLPPGWGTPLEGTPVIAMSLDARELGIWNVEVSVNLVEPLGPPNKGRVVPKKTLAHFSNKVWGENENPPAPWKPGVVADWLENDVEKGLEVESGKFDEEPLTVDCN